MSILASDNFDRADGGLGSNWPTEAYSVAPAIVSNQVEVTTDPGTAYYNPVIPPDDQWAQVTAVTPLTNSAGNGVGPRVRIDTAAETHYLLLADSTVCQLYVSVSAVYTQIGSNGPGFVNGDIAYIEAQGTSIVTKKNDSITSMPSGTNGAIASGRFGIMGADIDGVINPKLDDFQAGDFTIQVPVITPIYELFPKFPLVKGGT